MSTSTDTANTITVYYWLDGYWITDPEEAELMDSINAFGSLHQVANIPAGADIQQEVNRLLTA